MIVWMGGWEVVKVVYFPASFLGAPACGRNPSLSICQTRPKPSLSSIFILSAPRPFKRPRGCKQVQLGSVIFYLFDLPKTPAII